MIKTRNGEKVLPAPGFESLPRDRGSNPGPGKVFFINSCPTRHITKWDHEIPLNSSLDSKCVLDIRNTYQDVR